MTSVNMYYKKMKTRQKFILWLTFGIILYSISIYLFFLIANTGIHYTGANKEIEVTEQNSPIGEITKDAVIRQQFTSINDAIYGFSLDFATYGRNNTGNLRVKLIDLKNNKVLFENRFSTSDIQDSFFREFVLMRPIDNSKGKRFEIQITSDTESGNSVTIWGSDTFNNGTSMYINNNLSNQSLLFKVKGLEVTFLYKYFTQIFVVFGLLIVLYVLLVFKRFERGKLNWSIRFIIAFKQYKFLLSQLVARDFKTKYKRSFLGFLWSLLNPMIMMVVQYIVFSTVFKTDINNFAVYLLCGIVCFNFLSETSSTSINSIVGNAALINKVYMPKYIYPISKVLSSGINMLFSLIPLFLVILLTGIHFTPAFILLPFSFILLTIFLIGISLILSSVMVFFRDTQFLWSIIIMIWMYFTPIFYPETILPNNISFIFKLNPLYHFIRFIRIIILEGFSPQPQAYLSCIVFSVASLFAGILVFRKTQNKFVLYI